MDKSFVLTSSCKQELVPFLYKDREYHFMDEDNHVLLKAELLSYQIEFEVVDWGDVEENHHNTQLLSYYAHEITRSNTSGVEGMPDFRMEEPFNPDDISIETKPMTLDTVVRRIKQKSLVLNPDFQRNEVWDNDKKSKLIESLLLKIPIPMFYVSSDKLSKYTVVDGLQRLSAIRDFVIGYDKSPTLFEQKEGDGLRLTNLEFWKEFEGHTMNELPIYLQNRILETEFTFTIVNPGTPDDVQFTIFKRINTGGEPLNSQEIRNAMYGGPSSNLLQQMVQGMPFEMATGNSVPKDRMQDMELALGFCAFYIRKYTEYPQDGNLDVWLGQTMLLLNQFDKGNKKELVEDIANKKRISIDTLQIQYDYKIITDAFYLALLRAYSLFGDFAFRKSYSGTRRTPINKSLFSLWTVVLARLDENSFQSLLDNRDDFEKEYNPLLVNDDFVSSISRHSLFYLKVKSRFETIEKLVTKIISKKK